MDEDSFTYVLTPASSVRECFQRVVREGLPSLGEVGEYEGNTGTLLIDRDKFITDVLSGFDRGEGDCSFLRTDDIGRKKPIPGGIIQPTVVVPSGCVSSVAAPREFEEGLWPHVWTQFERDISRETLLVDGVLCDDASVALQRMRSLLSDAYDNLPSGFIRGTACRLAERLAERISTLPFVKVVWSVLEAVKMSYSESQKNSKVTEALRLAVLTAQQTVLALPVELLHIQFSRPSRNECGAGSDLERQTICIGESHENSLGDLVTTDSPLTTEGRRMIARIERRERGNRLPFVRVEKSLRVFTVDGAANPTTQLLLWVVVEIDLLTKDHVELKWEWRRP